MKKCYRNKTKNVNVEKLDTMLVNKNLPRNWISKKKI